VSSPSLPRDSPKEELSEEGLRGLGMQSLEDVPEGALGRLDAHGVSSFYCGIGHIADDRRGVHEVGEYR
jgi:hypothetical protein